MHSKRRSLIFRRGRYFIISIYILDDFYFLDGTRYAREKLNVGRVRNSLTCWNLFWLITARVDSHVTISNMEERYQEDSERKEK